jgi:ATP-binding cassette subfamily B protein
MDDITSALDARTEGLLWHRLRNESNNRVILVSTHREVTAMQADEVIWLDQGKIRAVDTHTNLLFTYPEYRHLFAKT